MIDRFWQKVGTLDTCDCWIWVAAKNRLGYGVFGIGKKTHLAHRAAYEISNGPIPAGKHLDHICHNPACVNPDHLRACTNQENSRNQTLKSSNKSGFKGVIKHGRGWEAQIYIDGKSTYLGTFDTTDAAHSAYCDAATRIFGEFANTGAGI